MGVTGITENKLFKIRTLDSNNPYQIGVNGVIDIEELDGDLSKIIYEIDDITYTTYHVTSISEDLSTLEYETNKSKKPQNKLNRGDGVNYIPSYGEVEKKIGPNSKETRYFINDDATNKTITKRFKRKNRTPLQSKAGDTTYQTNSFSFDVFDEFNIVKNDEYIGLINKPITESNLFMERDEFTIFERHQRLSEINNLAALTNYRNGYYELINTI